MLQINPVAVMFIAIFTGIFFIVVWWSDRQADRRHARTSRHRSRPAH